MKTQNTKNRFGIFKAIFAFLIGVSVLPLAAVFLVKPDHYGLSPTSFSSKAETSAPKLAIRAKDERPNIVLILADDLGYGDIEPNGGTVIRTPNLNSMAQNGARFTDYYAPAPVCSPSRAGMLTGRYPLRMGITFPFQPPQKKGIGPKIENKFVSLLASLGAVDMKAGGNMVDGLPTSELTIAEGLQQAGYKTGIVGKWHLGDFKILPQYHPNNHGFDWFVGFNASNDDWPVAFHRGEEEIISDIGLDQKKYTQLFTDEASGFISRNKDEPFFLFISHKDPHQPFYPSDKFAGKSKAGRYGDAVEELDNSVGEILQSLEQNGLTDNTIIIFTSDNGPWYEGNPGGLRGRKGMSYEGGNKVPFLIQYKGKITAGSVHTDPAMGIDLLPTIFSAAGVSLPQDRTIDGISLLNRNGKIDTDAIAASRPLYFASGFDFEAVRQGRFKLIDRNSTFGWPLPLDKPVGLAAASAPKYSPPNSDVSIPKLNDWPKLYDIVTDPTESYNISGNFSLEEQELKQTLEDWRTKFRKNPTGFK